MKCLLLLLVLLVPPGRQEVHARPLKKGGEGPIKRAERERVMELFAEDRLSDREKRKLFETIDRSRAADLFTGVTTLVLEPAKPVLQVPKIPKFDLSSKYAFDTQEDNYTATDNVAFLQDIYHKKTNKFLVGYFREEESICFLYKDENSSVPVMAVEKANGKSTAVYPRFVADKVDKYMRSLESTLRDAGTDKMSFALIKPYRSKDPTLSLQVGKDICELPAEAFIAFLIGQTAKPPQELTNLIEGLGENKDIILFRDSFQQATQQLKDSRYFIKDLYGKGAWGVNPARLALRLQQCFPGKHRVFIASDIESATRNYFRQPKEFNNFRIGMPGSGYKINSYQLANVLQSRLDKAQFIGPDSPPSSDFDILVTFGHKDKEFRRFQMDLGNSFKDKLLVLYSCYLTNEENWASDMIRYSDALGTVYFYRRIDPAAVKKVILKYSSLAGTPGYETDDKIELLRKIIDECILDPANKVLKPDLEALKNSLIYQLSEIDLSNKIRPGSYA